MSDDSDRAGEIRTAREILNYQDLLRLARDRSHKSRTELFEAIADLATNGERVLTARDRALMRDIIARLIEEVELSVRHALAERLSKTEHAPRELVVCLANDEIAVARPLLLKSTLLRDPELVEIIQYRTMEHQVAIAMRPGLGETVSEALVWTDRPEVIRTLLKNDSARISEGALSRLADKSVENVAYQAPLLHRRDLPPRLARKMYWSVSAALREHIVRNFDIDPDTLDDTIEDTIAEAVERDTDAASNPAGKSPRLPASARDRRRLMYLLDDGRVSEFVELFSQLSGLRATLARRMLFEPGGEATAIVCKAIGLDKDSFAPIFLRFRQGRLGDKRVEIDELTKALRNFDRITDQNAREVVRRWRRNPEFLNALRMIENAQG